MRPLPARSPLGWRLAFAASLVVGGASLALLLVALLVRFGETSEALPIGRELDVIPSPGERLPGGRMLKFSGSLPRGLEGLALTPAGAADPDLVFSLDAGPGAGVVTRIFVPVVPWHAALVNVTASELSSLAAGEVTFAALGGHGPAPRLAIVSPDVPAVGRLLPGSPSPAVFTSYDELRAAFADLSQGPYVALVPLEELGPGMTVLSLEGTDPLFAPDLAAWPYVERVSIETLTEAGLAARPAIEDRLRFERPPVTRIVLTGDILMVRCALDAIRATGDWAAPFRGPVGGFLAGADLALGSLDSSIQDIGEPYGCVQTTNLTAPPETIEALTVAGFDAVSLATNHASDCGQAFCGIEALTRTIELLTAAGIKAAGAGIDLEAALAPAIFEVNGVTVGVLAFDDIAAENLGATETAPGTAPLDDSYDDEREEFPEAAAFYGRAETLSLARFIDRIQRLRQVVDIVVVQVQTGYEDTHDPSPRSVKALRAAASAGADLVIGNQAHWAGTLEVRDGRFIAYALGNFVFDQLHTPEHSEGYLVEAILLGNRLATVRLHPYRVEDRHRPEFAGHDLRLKILRDVIEAAERLREDYP